MTLHEARLGSAVRVLDVSSHPSARRLVELGLRPGARVEVLRRTSGDGRLLGLGSARMAVDRSTAASLLVEPVAGPTP